jgi:hypothetical protein
MRPIEKLNELSNHAINDVEYNTPAKEIKSDNMQIQLQVDERELRKREMESRQAL